MTALIWHQCSAYPHGHAAVLDDGHCPASGVRVEVAS